MVGMRYRVICIIVVQYKARDSIVQWDGSTWLQFAIDCPGRSCKGLVHQDLQDFFGFC